MEDDYVAEVLAKEARDSTKRYTAEGLSAYVPRKPAANAPKPNTRFLRNLIKETDSHNTALKRKEERDAKERMRQLKAQSKSAPEAGSQSSRRSDREPTHRDSERRHGDDRDGRRRSHRRRDRSRSTSKERDRSRRHRRRYEDDDRMRDRERTDQRRERHRHESSREARREKERSYSRSRSRSPRHSRSSRHHRSERRRSKSPSGTRSHKEHERQQSRRDREDERGSRQARQTRLSPAESSPGRRHRKDSPSDESDPLEDLVGPLPAKDNPVRSRGRGAYKANTSTIDAHFAPDYDPALDVQLDHEGSSSNQPSRRPVSGLMTEEDDWDMALEALRDRANWRRKGEDRLRAAGINESAIDKWKNEPAFAGLDGERRPEDVRWSKEGEGREWDRGKFVDGEGHIDVRATW